MGAVANLRKFVSAFIGALMWRRSRRAGEHPIGRRDFDLPVDPSSSSKSDAPETGSPLPPSRSRESAVAVAETPPGTAAQVHSEISSAGDGLAIGSQAA